jgi:hypothetical protein
MAWLVVVAALALAGTAHAGEAPGLERMYVLSCGESRTPDVSRWSPGVNIGQPWEFSNHCYLIRHARGLMLWDAGMSDAIAAMPDGLTAAGGALVLRVRKTLAAQLQELGVAAGDVTHLAFSHFHADHVGNANLFTGARLYIQALEYEAAFGPTPGTFNFAPANYEKLRANPVVKLTGDHDVFGDGTVTIVATPGHTPGPPVAARAAPPARARPPVGRHGALPGQLDPPARPEHELRPRGERAHDGEGRRAARRHRRRALDQPRQAAERDHPQGPRVRGVKPEGRGQRRRSSRRAPAPPAQYTPGRKAESPQAAQRGPDAGCARRAGA